MEKISTYLDNQRITDKGECPDCGVKLLWNEGNGQLLKGVGCTKFLNGGLVVKCRECKSFVDIPLEMLKGLQIPVKFYGKQYKMKIR